MAEGGGFDFGLGDEVNRRLNEALNNLPHEERAVWEVLFLEDDLDISAKRHQTAQMFASQERGLRRFKNTMVAIGVLGLSALSIYTGYEVVRGEADSGTLWTAVAAVPALGGVAGYGVMLGRMRRVVAQAVEDLETPDN